jgi:hypothetical protein
LKSRLDQVEQDMYKARTEKTDAIKARDGLAVELITAKKAKEDVDKQLADAIQQISVLSAKTEGRLSPVTIVDLSKQLSEKQVQLETLA